MNKILFSLIALATASAIAQTPVTAPSAPVVPNTPIVSPNAVSALANSSTNRVFIDQIGNNPNINITQEGSGNSAGDSARPLYLRGINQTVITRQIGANNQISLEAVNGDVGANEGINVTVQQTGNNNSVDASCGYGTLSDGTTALTGCRAAVINWNISGNNNNIQFRASGTEIQSAITANGNANVFNIDVLGDKHSQTLVVNGDTNTFNLTQTSAGSAGSSILVNLSGTSNAITVSQTGTVDSVLNIRSVSNSGNFNIVQRN